MTAIYHITHLSNLARIIEEGGLCCDRLRNARQIACTGIAYEHIKRRRAQRVVPIGHGSTLEEYVPFYFAPRSPMLYAIHTGYVENYDGGQVQVLHLVGSAEAIAKAGYDYVFTDGHADMFYTKYFASLDRLDGIDWPIMSERYWNDTPEDGDRKRRRQAEFLVREFVPWSQVTEIGVLNAGVASSVTQILSRSEHRPNITVKREWYY